MAGSWNQGSQVYRRYIRNLATLYETRQDIRFFIEAILSLIVIAIFGAFAIRPTLVTIGNLNSEIASKEETEEILDRKIANLARAEDLYAQQAESISLLNSAIPVEPDPIAYTRQIEGIKKRTDVEITNLSLARTTIKGVHSTSGQTSRTSNQDELFREIPFPENASHIPMTLDASGTYEAISTFIGYIEGLLRPFYYDSVIVSRSRDSDTELILSVGGKVPFVDLTQIVESEAE